MEGVQAMDEFSVRHEKKASNCGRKGNWENHPAFRANCATAPYYIVDISARSGETKQTVLFDLYGTRDRRGANYFVVQYSTILYGTTVVINEGIESSE